MIDEELVYNYRLGNKEALSFLFSLYEKKVAPFYYKYEKIFKAVGYDSDDMKMFVYDCVLKAVNGYQFGNKKFNTYYSSIAYRSIISLYRSIEGKYEEKIGDYSLRLSENNVEETFYYNDHENDNKELNYVLERIKEIGEKEFLIIKYYLEGNSYKEIADKMSIKVKSVTNYIQKIRRKLRKMEIK